MATGGRVRDLLAELDRLQRPGLVKASPSRVERCKREATEVYARATDGAAERREQRELARQVGVNERSIRDWRSGGRLVPLWAVMALPREERLAVVRSLVETCASDNDSNSDDDTQRHTA